jgi:hypothetical protein
MVVGAIAPNAHEGYVFASFGAAVAIPHQEDSGILGPAKEHIKFALLARCDSVRRSLLTSARDGS